MEELIHIQENLPQPPGVLNADGFAICPECYSRINCGTAGLANLALHRGKGTCKKAQEKRSKEGKKKNMSILSFLKKPMTKSTPIPSTVSHHEPIHSRKLPTATSAIIPSYLADPCTEDELAFASTSLPDTIPEATEYDKLAVFAGNPAKYDDPSLDGDDLWETSQLCEALLTKL